MSTTTIPGYTYATTASLSPLTADDFEHLKQSVLFSEDDERYLHMAGQVLADQIG